MHEKGILPATFGGFGEESLESRGIFDLSVCQNLVMQTLLDYINSRLTKVLPLTEIQ